MPLFSRRHSSTGQYNNNVSASSSAAIAASSAFLKSSPSTTSLSSAAAAAALRSHATSPEPVGNIQTKRMMRRGSQSSIGSGAIMNSAPAQTRRPLSRTGSQSSMTERSFRSPSPHGARPAASNAPPVPAVKVPAATQPTRPRASSIEGPPPARPASALGRLQNGRSPSPGAVNFSRPMSPDSPSSPVTTNKRGSWFGPPSTSNNSPRQTASTQKKQPISITPQEVASIQARIQAAANSPSTKKPSSASAVQGARLAAGSLAPSPSVSKKSTPASRPQSQAGLAAPATTKAAARVDGAKSPTPLVQSRTAGTSSKRASVIVEADKPNGSAKLAAQTAKPASRPASRQAASAQRDTSANRNGSVTASPSTRPVSLEVPDGKSAHFSSKVTDSSTGPRHDPPARSVSPAKSAMKHSPASSIRTTSPSGYPVPHHRGPGSDTSDAISTTSQDGLKGGRKKKARVSFTEDVPAVVITDGQTISKTRSASLTPSEDDNDETMKPRPALPSFGSVRNREPDTAAEKVTETLSDDKETKSAPQGVSSDHAIASILHNADKSALAEPEVNAATVPTLEVNGHAAEAEAEEKESTLTVPDIAVQPATPGIEEEATKALEPAQEKPQQASGFHVPGGWDDADDYAEPELTLATIVEAAESGSEDEAFSDAAEQHSPSGFASLNAIVESPIPKTSPKVSKPATAEGWERTSAYWSQHKKMLQERTSPNKQDDVFDDSIPVEPKTEDLDARSESEYDDDERDIAEPTPVPAPVAAKPKTAHPAPQSKPIKSAMKTTMRGPPPAAAAAPTQPTMRKSMRQNAPAPAAPAATDSAMQRKTMRPAATSSPAVVAVKQIPPALAKPTRTISRDDSDSESSFKKKRRPASISESGRYTMRRSMRSGSIDSTQSPAQAPAGSGRWSVRSVSPVQSSQNNRAAFRQSMRPKSLADAPTMRGENSRANKGGAKNNNRFSMPGFSKTSKPADTASVTSKSRFRSRFADSDSEGEPAAASAPRSMRGGFRSRFADSDEEGEPSAAPTPGLTPVRGIPHPLSGRKDDSSDLDDSSDGEARARPANGDKVIMRSKVKPVVPDQSDIDRAMAQARQNVAAMTGNQQLLQPQPVRGKMQKRGSSRPPSVLSQSIAEPDGIQRRRGLLGSIFGRRNSDASVMSMSRQASYQGSPVQTPPMSPASTRGRLQRRNTPSMIRTTSGLSTMTASTNVPATNGADANWPLTPQATAAKPPMPKSLRPSTSDGVPASTRTKQEDIPPVPPLPQNGNVQNGAGKTEVKEKEEKKKRFGKLRRAFGL